MNDQPKPWTPPLSGHWLEMFQERAAIMEFDGKLTRQDAEAAAWVEIQRKMREAKDRDLFTAGG